MILEAILKVGNRVGNRVGNLTDNQVMIIQMMRDHKNITAKNLSSEIGISLRKIEENIAKLKKLDIIKRVGGTRGHWEVNS
jgi:predicted HTH transcriptional regulator